MRRTKEQVSLVAFSETSSSVAGCELRSIPSEACSSHGTSHPFSGCSDTLVDSVKEACLEPPWAPRPSVKAATGHGNKISRKLPTVGHFVRQRRGKLQTSPSGTSSWQTSEQRRSERPLSITPFTFTPEDPHSSSFVSGQLSRTLAFLQHRPKQHFVAELKLQPIQPCLVNALV